MADADTNPPADQPVATDPTPAPDQSSTDPPVDDPAPASASKRPSRRISQQSSPARSDMSLSQVDGPDLTELKTLVDSMKSTLVTLAGTFENFGEQTARVASLKPDIDVAHQVSSITYFLKLVPMTIQIKHIRQKLKHSRCRKRLRLVLTKAS